MKNKKKYVLCIHIRPYEIDKFEYQIIQLIRSSYYINDYVLLYLNLDMSTDYIDYELSNIKKDYFIEKFKYLCNLASKYYKVEFNITENKHLLDTRRKSYEIESDYVIWLDPDIYFNQYTLVYLINNSKLIKDDNFILTPNIIKYWDNSWNVIVNKKYINYPFNHRDFFDSYSIDSEFSEEVSIRVNNSVKIGGGWFNLFSTNLLRKIGIPESFGGFGPDDTFIALCCNAIGYKQYVLENVVVTEVGKFLIETPHYNYISDNLHFKHNNGKVRIGDDVINVEVDNFIKKINEVSV